MKEGFTSSITKKLSLRTADKFECCVSYYFNVYNSLIIYSRSCSLIVLYNEWSVHLHVYYSNLLKLITLQIQYYYRPRPISDLQITFWEKRIRAWHAGIYDITQSTFTSFHKYVYTLIVCLPGRIFSNKPWHFYPWRWLLPKNMYIPTGFFPFPTLEFVLRWLEISKTMNGDPGSLF